MRHVQQILIATSANLLAVGLTISVIHDVFPVPHIVLWLLPYIYLFVWLAPMMSSFWMGARPASQSPLASWMLVSSPWAAGIAYSLWASFDPAQSCDWSGSWREYYLTFAGGSVLIPQALMQLFAYTSARALVHSGARQIGSPRRHYVPRRQIYAASVLAGLSLLSIVPYPGARSQILSHLLITATEIRDPRLVRALLAQGVSPDTVDRYRDPALILSARNGSASIAKVLLDAGARVDGTDRFGGTALMYAVDHPKLTLAKLLIAREANVNAVSAPGGSALVRAAQMGNAGAVHLLLSKGADANLADPPTGETALMGAAASGSAEMIGALVARGARVNALSNAGQTALMAAASTGSVAAVTALIARGSHVNQASSDDRITALMLAAGNGQTPAVNALLSAGASVNARERHGRTALMAAATWGYGSTAKVLLRAGADTTLRDQQGETAFDKAARMGHSQVRKVLTRHGRTWADADAPIVHPSSVPRASIHPTDCLARRGSSRLTSAAGIIKKCQGAEALTPTPAHLGAWPRSGTGHEVIA